jgi:hypothetical protein
MWTRMKRLWRRWVGKCKVTHDIVDLQLPSCHIYLERKSTLPIAHELQVVIPRVELKEIIFQDGTGIRIERQAILNSVTVVSAPRREQSPGGNL